MIAVHLRGPEHRVCVVCRVFIHHSLFFFCVMFFFFFSYDLVLVRTLQVNPNNHEYITVSELVRSGVGHTVCGILTDVEAFFAYDNREMQDGGP